MKIYKNQTRDNAKQNGFLSNFEFAKDKIMSPNHIDYTILNNTITKRKYMEETLYDPVTDTCNIKIYAL